ncbi:hypothetical protein [Microbaculum marinisediminis]|nr:hypothetical protein [Microbaculum sp. A6E488]
MLNDTGDFYRFFDATPHAEFLFACGAQVYADILHVLLKETRPA